MWDMSNFSLSVQCSRGESSHHTNGSKAPRPTHFVIDGIIVVYRYVLYLLCRDVWYTCVEICGIVVVYKYVV